MSTFVYTYQYDTPGRRLFIREFQACGGKAPTAYGTLVTTSGQTVTKNICPGANPSLFGNLNVEWVDTGGYSLNNFVVTGPTPLTNRSLGGQHISCTDLKDNGLNNAFCPIQESTLSFKWWWLVLLGIVLLLVFLGIIYAIFHQRDAVLGPPAV